MNDRLAWQALPLDVRAAVQAHTGVVVEAESSSAGRNSAFSASLRTADGLVFCKGGRTNSPQAFMHRNEALVNPLLPRELAPKLRWQVEQDGWLLLGFEHVPGRHADLTPNSADLPLVADAVRRIGAITAPTTDRRIADHWVTALGRENADGLAARAPQYMHGSTLVHSDLNPLNILITESAHVVDWAWWRTGAAWIDPAFVVVRLVAEGHDPAQAEEWAAAQFDAFRSAPTEAVTAFAASLVCLWERRFAGTDVTEAARRWAGFRTANGPRLREDPRAAND
ncbi:hypothetical protein BBK82_46895 [Lentzea guizhouensis]|uniref:Aminoglycoside phosphotransferase domain-containing protein n=1 Tax=Lentzea guizhouensis TaxID=1586287 RepID=A0A1B2HX94_9PSEU|nr:hypothetical protein [Lentzea guizhouensis]ANZ42336.1 hypothetical protein BBK82_46895 [Lentzea guizhouensis]